jgi:hypothetical protein
MNMISGRDITPFQETPDFWLAYTSFQRLFFPGRTAFSAATCIPVLRAERDFERYLSGSH